MDALKIPQVQDALEEQRQRQADDVARLTANVEADLPDGDNDLEALVEAAHRGGVLDAICAEHDVTDAVMARSIG